MKNVIKKTIFFALFFILFSVIINSVFLTIIAYTDWDFKKRLESLRFDNPDFKLLILGASLAEYGIDTELLTSQGTKSFNLAFVGSSNNTSYVQLNEYLRQYSKRPLYVLLAVNSNLEEFNQNGIQPVIEFTMKGHKYCLKDIPISKFRWAGMEILKKSIRPQYRKTYVSYGQKKSQYFEIDTSHYYPSYLDIHKFESSYWIGEIAKLCSQNGIQLIIVDIPGVKATQNLSEIGPYKLSFKNGQSATLYNFNNQNFCKFIDVNKDWCGRSHFNKFGAAKFTKRLIDTIKFNN
jgi:hypothetical protein